MPSTNQPNHVVVTVDANGKPACTPDPVPARGKNITMHFALAADGYVFRDENAVVVSDPGSQFPQPSQTEANGTKATLHNHNTECADFKYTVYLKQLATGAVIDLDPIIQNEG